MMLRNTRDSRRGGTVVVVAAVCLIALLSVAALSLDGGLLMDKRRQTQAAADAAALAGAAELYVNWFTSFGADTTDQAAYNTALKVAESNGFKDGENGCVVTVNIPPLSGPFAGQTCHVEVIISYPQRRFFSRLFGSEDVPVGARAVARGKRSTANTGILVLAPEGRDTLSVGGNGLVQVSGSASVIVNSTDAQAMIANGGASISATEYDLSGRPGWANTGSGTITGQIFSGQEPTPDPLRFLPPPDITTLTVRSGSPTNPDPVRYSGGSRVLYPGVYYGGISIGGQADVTLMPGIYYMAGGGFSFSGQGTLIGNGVMIYNAPTSTSDKVDISGQGNVTLSPMTTGTYKGLAIFQDRTATTPININGSNAVAMSITGTFYGASAQLSVAGNGLSQTIGGQYISKTLAISGNGGFTVDWNPTLLPGTRECWLVE